MIAIAIFTLSACDYETEDENVVYVTVYPMEFLLKEIGGDDIIVKRVPGSEVHSESIDWSAKEIIDMINSDLLFYINGGADPYIPQAKDSVFKDSNTKLLDMSNVIEYEEVCISDDHDHEEEGHEHDDHESEECATNKAYNDPHFWMDPVRMRQAAEYVRDQLIAEFPEFETDFIVNHMELDNKLEELHSEYLLMASQVTKPIITTSLLYNYLEVRYGIEIFSMSTSAHASESTPGDITEILEEARFHQINYILYEMHVNSPTGDALYNELNTDGYNINKAELHGLGNLLSEERKRNENYFTLMRHNLEVLNNATK